MTGPDAPFEEPWQARAFALAVHLHAQGAFAWADWTRALGAEIARDGSDYWTAWLRALEGVLEAGEVASREDVARTARLWQDAARATPHGSAIELPVEPGPAASG